MAYEVYEPWKNGVRGAIGEQGTVPLPETMSPKPTVSVSPPQERGTLERIKEYLNQPIVTGDPFSAIRPEQGPPPTEAEIAVASKPYIGSYGQGSFRSDGRPTYIGADRAAAETIPERGGISQPFRTSERLFAPQAQDAPIAPNYGPGILYNVPKPQQAATSATNSGGVPLDERLARMRDELAMYNARDRADQQGRIQAMGANANWASDWTAKRDAESAARVANFRATNGADMVLASGSREYEGQRLGILGAAKDANANLKTANEDLRKSQDGLTGAPRNYIDEAAKEQASIAAGIGTRARASEDLAKASLAGPTAEGIREETRVRKLTADQHQQTVDLISKMSSAKTPAEARAAERALFAMHGKSPENWDAKILTGKVYYGEFGQITGKDADTALFINKTTGEKELVGSAQGGSTKTPQQADIDILKKNASAPGVKEGFDKEFGPGAAAKILGK